MSVLSVSIAIELDDRDIAALVEAIAAQLNAQSDSITIWDNAGIASDACDPAGEHRLRLPLGRAPVLHALKALEAKRASMARDGAAVLPKSPGLLKPGLY